MQAGFSHWFMETSLAVYEESDGMLLPDFLFYFSDSSKKCGSFKKSKGGAVTFSHICKYRVAINRSARANINYLKLARKKKKERKPIALPFKQCV